MTLIWGNSDPERNMFAKTELVNLLVSEDVEARDRSEATPGHHGRERTAPIPHRLRHPSL